jgi:hypothetical protein
MSKTYMVTFVTSETEVYTASAIMQNEGTNEHSNNGTAPSQDT